MLEHFHQRVGGNAAVGSSAACISADVLERTREKRLRLVLPEPEA
jgi:hypothetical protein